MTQSEAKELLRAHVQACLPDTEVTFTRQSRAAKPLLPLVTLTFGNASRPVFPNYDRSEEDFTACYQTRVRVTVDLFTHGTPVVEEETGETAAYEDTAVDEMLLLLNHLDSPYTTAWCHAHDTALLADGQVQNLSNVLNDNNYEFRSEVSLFYYFTQTAAGYTGISDTAGEELADATSGYFTEAEIEEAHT